MDEAVAATKKVKIWIKLFVAFHVAGISIWCLHDPRQPIVQGTVEPYGTDWILFYNWKYFKQLPPIRFYMNTAGVWQYWDMFAPNPSNTDLWGDAMVEYEDGTAVRYPYYRINAMPIPVKYYRERFRKFFERAGMPGFQYLYDAFGQRVALEMDTKPGNPPVRVRLRRHLQRIPPLGEGPPLPYVTEQYHVYEVDQEALARARASASKSKES
jgi:hypothetical protein